jgi:hypothetical protein
MEGRELRPSVGDDGVRRFDAEEVEALARSTGRASRAGEPLSAGELAAEVFARLEQRQSLSEIVRALKVEPRKVRALYHEWRIGLERAEMARRDAAPPVCSGVLRAGPLAKLLESLPEGETTRISVAQRAGDVATYVWGEVVELFDELDGFVTEGPVTIGELRQRYGTGDVRVSAYSIREQRLLWQVYATIRSASNATEPG